MGSIFSSLREINVLVVGTTGSGKSTFINMLQSVIMHRSLKDAKKSDVKCPIPVTFSVKNHEIVHGDDANERPESARSRTCKPKVYSWRTKDFILRVIDTPGMGDTDGSESDEEHVAHIISCMKSFKHIDAILLVFKSSENTLSAPIQYQLSQLLSCFGKEAARNIYFVITHAGYLNRPGQAGSVIESIISNMNANVPFEDENTFCFENDSFRYLMASRHPEVQFSQKEQAYYAQTYENSVREYERLIHKLFKSVEPYSISNVTMLHEGRQIWPFLSEIPKTLGGQLSKLKKTIEGKERTIEKLRSETSSYMADLYVIKTVVHHVEVNKQRTVDVPEWYEDTKIVYEDVVEEVTKWRMEECTEFYTEIVPRIVSVPKTVKVPKQYTVTKYEWVDVPKQEVEYYYEYEYDKWDWGLNPFRRNMLLEFVQSPGLQGRKVRKSRVVTRMVKEKREREEVVNYTSREVRYVKETKYEEVQKERVVQKPVQYTKSVTRKIPKTVSVKKLRKVPKIVNYVEQEPREKLVKEINPSVQEKIEQLEQKRLEKEGDLNQLRQKFDRFQSEVNHLIKFHKQLLCFLQETALVSLVSRDIPGLSDTDSTLCCADEKPLPAEELLMRLNKLSELEFVGSSVTEALHKCRSYSNYKCDTVEMESGYLLNPTLL